LATEKSRFEDPSGDWPIAASDPFRLHFENLPDPAYLWVGDGDRFRIRACNLAARRLRHARTNEVVELATERFMADPEFVADIRTCLETGAAVTRETSYSYLLTGVNRHVAVSFVPVAADMVVVQTRDVTEHRLAVERLRESVARYELSAEGSHEGLWEWDLKTDGIYLSPTWKALMGYTDGDPGSDLTSVTALVHPDDVDGMWEAVTSHLEQRVSYDREFRLRHRDGHYVWVHAMGQAIWDESGEPVRMAGSIRDITEARRTEQEVIGIIESERQRIGRDLHDGLGQELTGISLGLRTLAARLAREGSPLEDDVVKLGELVQKSIVDTRRIARVLSPAFSREQRLGDTLRALAAEIDRHAGVTCHAHCTDVGAHDDPEAATHVFRIAQEAVANALRHSGAKRIEVAYGPDGNGIVLEVVDDGVGIPAKEVRTDGLGLRSMHYRARMLNGRLAVAPRASGGTRVVCRYPLKQPAKR